MVTAAKDDEIFMRAPVSNRKAQAPSRVFLVAGGSGLGDKMSTGGKPRKCCSPRLALRKFEGPRVSELSAWDSFYVIVGGAAGALIGLQFVVMTLIAEKPSAWIAEAGPVFSTPTIVHFSAILLVSALLRVPWPTVMAAAFACGAVGLSGLIYTLLLAWRMHKQTAYQPDAEDWSFHLLLPLLAYALLTLAPLPSLAQGQTLFGIGAGVLLLLFAGIHNAWDAVTYQVFVLRKPGPDNAPPPD